MLREERSERCRRLVLDAALRLFARHGYGATSVRQIAEEAGVSVGAVYHHFPDKEAMFRTLIDEYKTITTEPRFPYYRAIRTGLFPNNLEQLGYAARDSVRQYRDYQVLFFVDVIEFQGEHVREFYEGLAERFTAFLEEQKSKGDDMPARLRPGVSPQSALMLASRIFFNYFQMEILFGVAEPFGKSSAEMVREVADILRFGFGNVES
jgi:AcrR family transcriptional regulator